MLFQAPSLDGQELEVIDSIKEVRRRLQHLLYEPPRWQGLLRRSVAAGNIRASTGIEGHHVSHDDATAAVDGTEPFEATGHDWEAVRGYRDAMDYIIQLVSDPHFTYSDGVIRSIHYMMMKHDRGCLPGLYRPDPIFVGAYEGPDPEIAPDLVRELIMFLNDPADNAPVLVRAAMAHLNLLMIHPFKDGNGRMSRALQTLVLGRDGPLDPRFSSIEEYLGRNTPAYYQVLAEVGGTRWSPDRDARPWIRFVLTAHHCQVHLMAWRVEEADRLWGSSIAPGPTQACTRETWDLCTTPRWDTGSADTITSPTPMSANGWRLPTSPDWYGSDSSVRWENDGAAITWRESGYPDRVRRGVPGYPIRSGVRSSARGAGEHECWRDGGERSGFRIQVLWLRGCWENGENGWPAVR